MSDEPTPIEEAAAQPKKGAIDGQSFEQHSLTERIEAERHEAAKRAARKPGFGVKFARIIPPGAA